MENQVVFVAFVDNGSEYEHERTFVGVYSTPGLAMGATLDWARTNYKGEDYYRNSYISILRGEVNNHMEEENIPLYTSGHWLWNVININTGA